MPRRSRQEIGQAGEDAAEEFLKRNHFKILERNFRTRLGEIDMIAEEGDTLCFVEVKTRTSGSRGGPAEAVTTRKQRRIARVAALYLDRYYPSGRSCRFDVVMVIEKDGVPEAEIVRDAFSADDMYLV